jgi:ABC-type cobalamin transport system ATPase subunit
MKSATNLIICGPNGVGKTTIAANVAHLAVLNGQTALFTTAAGMLNELAELDSDSALRRRIKYYLGMQLTNLPTTCSVWYYEYLPHKFGRVDGSFSN